MCGVTCARAARPTPAADQRAGGAAGEGGGAIVCKVMALHLAAAARHIYVNENAKAVGGARCEKRSGV